MNDLASRLAAVLGKRMQGTGGSGQRDDKRGGQRDDPNRVWQIGLVVAGTEDKRATALAKLVQAVFPRVRCTTLNLRAVVKDYWVLRKNTKGTREIGPLGRESFALYMERLCTRTSPFVYDGFVCIDAGMAHHLLPERDVKGKQDTDYLHGMITEIFGKPVLFHFDPLNTYGFGYDPEHRAVYSFMSGFAVKKLHNRLLGRPGLERPTKFIVPQSAADMRACAKLLSRAALIAADIETSGGYISVIGFAAHVPGLDYTPIVVIPLMTNMDDTGRYWADDALTGYAMDVIGEILANPAPKCFHNGSYDLTYIFRYGWTVENFIFDTMHMLHALWPTMPKALYIGASMFLSNYRYWKDDGKDVDDAGKVKWQVPNTPEKTYNYWLYNGLDCANTLELCLALLRYWFGEDNGEFPEWSAGFGYVWRNYVREFSLQYGPAFYMSMHGMRVSDERQFALKRKLMGEAIRAREDLCELLDDQDFNPNSAAQVQHVLYDVLNITPLPRKGRSTDKRIVRAFADIHPIYATVINAIAAAKEPMNNVSKYGDMEMWAGRWWAQLKAGNTTTGRFASSKHNLGYGTNLQNVPKSMRVMGMAEEGELLVSADYSQSDSYFVAFESGDEVMIQTVTDDRDTHAVHVEFFFGDSYDAVVAGAAANEPWVVHPVTGKRQIIKKVSHGTNYDMGGATMLMNIGKPAALAMINALLRSSNAGLFIKFLGLDTSKPPEHYLLAASSWNQQLLERSCEFAQALYYMRYPTLKRWKIDAVAQAWRDNGVIEMFGGSSTVMLCSPKTNPRFVPAAKGQGGTAGNINNAMLRLYLLCADMWAAGFRMVLQVHDELISAVPERRLDLVARKTAVMQMPCVIRGREFVVPVEAEISRSWSAKFSVPFKGLDEHDVDGYLNLVDEKERKLAAQLGLV